MKAPSGIVRALADVIVFAAVLLSAVAQGETNASAARIGVLPLANSQVEESLREGLRALGYIEGKNILIEWMRPPEANEEKVRRYAVELARAKVDIIVAVGSTAARAALQATRVPVVFAVGDPVAAGFAASLARPGGNGTGLSALTTELDAKRLELLKQLAPRARRIASLFNPTNPLARKGGLRNSARNLGVEIVNLEAGNAEELDAVLRSLPHSAVDGVLIAGDLLLFANKAKVAQAVRKARIPSVFPWAQYHDDAVLMSYGPSMTEAMYRVAVYVDKILKGSKPADMPVEQLSKYELIIDLRVAREMELEVPQSLLLRADKVIR